MSTASVNTKDVMVSFLTPTLSRVDDYCARTGLKRSTVVMQALTHYLNTVGSMSMASAGDLHPQPAHPKTGSLVKTKLRHRGKR